MSPPAGRGCSWSLARRDDAISPLVDALHEAILANQPAISTLIHDLTDGSYERRFAARSFLQERADDAILPLMRALQKSRQEAFECVMRAGGGNTQFHQRAALSPGAKIRPKVRAKVAMSDDPSSGSSSVPVITEPKDPATAKYSKVNVKELAKKPSQTPILKLISRFKSSKRKNRVVAARALERRGSEAVLPLINATKSSDVRVRAWAVTVLGNIGDDVARTALEQSLDDSSYTVRNRATLALAKLPSSGFRLVAVRESLDGENFSLEDALESVEVDEPDTKEVKLRPEVTEALKKLESGSDIDRAWAITRLGELKAKEVASKIRSAAKADSSRVVRLRAESILKELGLELEVFVPNSESKSQEPIPAVDL